MNKYNEASSSIQDLLTMLDSIRTGHDVRLFYKKLTISSMLTALGHAIKINEGLVSKIALMIHSLIVQEVKGDL